MNLLGGVTLTCGALQLGGGSSAGPPVVGLELLLRLLLGLGCFVFWNRGNMAARLWIIPFIPDLRGSQLHCHIDWLLLA